MEEISLSSNAKDIISLFERKGIYMSVVLWKFFFWNF